VTTTGRASQRPPVQVVVCPDGPLLLRGAVDVVGEAGERIPVERPVVALCRCGRSSRTPWCDGTHKLLRRRTAARPTEEDLDD
jgi:CDGSH-type Zn-finger protein